MGVIDGNPVNAAYTNPRFLDAEVDDTMLAKLTFNDAGAGSGGAITNAQSEFNSISFFIGRITNGTLTNLPPFTNNQGFGADDLFIRTDALSGKFHNISGHAHTGNPGDAPQVTANTISGVPLQSYPLQGANLLAVTGSSRDVSTELSGKNPSAVSTVEGVVVNNPYNKILIQQASGPDKGDAFLDGFGNIVFGRLTYSIGVWTLDFFVDLAGVETSYSFAVASDVAWFYQELFNPLGTPPTYTAQFYIPSDNATQDVIDATPTQRGLISAGAQSLGGLKTLVNGLVYDLENNSQAGADQNISITAKRFIRLTGAVTSIVGFSGGVTGEMRVIYNDSGADITIKDDDGLGSNKIYTGTGQDFTFKDKSVIIIFFNDSTHWTMVGGGGGGAGVGYQETPSGVTNGINASFGPLTYLPTDTNSVAVYVDGVAQVLGTEFIVTGSTITFQPGFIPSTGQSIYAFYLTQGNPSLPIMSGQFKTEYRTVTAGEDLAKALVLSGLPSTPTEVILDVISGGPQFYGDDFTVSGSTLSWSGLGLDGLLLAGDKVRISYVI